MDVKVSIIIPTYKRSDRIERAVNSALRQEYDNFEVIVVDDNDPNTFERKNTEKNLEKFNNDERFKYIKHKYNRNGSAARNTGIKNSTGQYITFLDDDDEYYPNKIKIQANTLEKLNNEWGICYSAYKKIDQFNNIQYSNETAEGNIIIQALTKNLFMGSGSNFMVRRNIIEELDGFDETFQRNQDIEFLARVLLKYKIKYIDEILLLVHNEIREKKYSFKELNTINNFYRSKFKSIINKLTIDEQHEVYKTLDLWDIRNALSNYQIYSGIKIFLHSRLSILELNEYFLYIIKRIITKKSYGFKFSS